MIQTQQFTSTFADIPLSIGFFRSRHHRGLVKAVIGCIGEVDAYLLPDAKGYQAMLRHLLGEDNEYNRQIVRDQHLGSNMVHGVRKMSGI